MPFLGIGTPGGVAFQLTGPILRVSNEAEGAWPVGATAGDGGSGWDFTGYRRAWSDPVTPFGPDGLLDEEVGFWVDPNWFGAVSCRPGLVQVNADLTFTKLNSGDPHGWARLNLDYGSGQSSMWAHSAVFNNKLSGVAVIPGDPAAPKEEWTPISCGWVSGGTAGNLVCTLTLQRIT